MRRSSVEYQPEALLDLEEIYRYVSSKSQNRVLARDFVKRIKARCHKIGFVPHGGAPRDDLEDGLRMVPFEHSAVILYKVESDRVRITNIVYGGRDYEALYRGVPENERSDGDE